MITLKRVSATDILRPKIIIINGIRYRSNEAFYKDESYEEEKVFRMKDLEVSCDPYEDECCDSEEFPVEETKIGYKVTLQFPSAFFRYIIGQKGETRHRLESETNVKITLPPIGHEGDVVVVGKEKKNVFSACTRISLIVDNEKKKQPFTHFLSFPVICDSITKNFEEFKNLVLSSYHAKGIDESIFQNPKKLHITLGVMVLVGEKDIEKAEKVLQECKHRLSDDGLFESPLDIEMEGLEYMNDDPTSVDVLYGKVKLKDGTDRLQRVADEFVQSCVTSGLMTKQYDNVKLHVTLMNTLFRKDADPDMQKGRGGGGRRERERFNAMGIIKNLRSFHFGLIRLRSLHLSKRHSVDSGGYYAADSFIEL